MAHRNTGVWADYQVRLLDTIGNQVAVFDDWRVLYFGQKVNNTSWYQFSINDDDPRRELFELDGTLEIWRRWVTNGVRGPWYREFAAFHRTTLRQAFTNGNFHFTSFGRGFVDLLARRIIAYKKGTPEAAKNGGADNIMKQFVKENATPDALILNGRLANGIVAGLSVQDEFPSTATTWSGDRSGDNLLSVVQSIADFSGVDFDVVSTSDPIYGFPLISSLRSWEFRTYENQRGLDKTAPSVAEDMPVSTGGVVLNDAGNVPVILSMEFGNMDDANLSFARTEEANAVFVFGPGDDDDRLVVVRDSSDQYDSVINRFEIMRTANDIEDEANLEIFGDEVLAEKQVSENLTFKFIHQPSTVYGRDFMLGDRITTIFKGQRFDKRVIAVTINVSGGDSGPGKEEIELEFDDIP